MITFTLTNLINVSDMTNLTNPIDMTKATNLILKVTANSIGLFITESSDAAKRAWFYCRSRLIMLITLIIITKAL